MSLPTPPKVRKFQDALRTKAKESDGYRFYSLYDKIYRRDILEYAYLRSRANDGAPGIDGMTFDDIEAYGREKWLDELTESLRNKTYLPKPVRRKLIPKDGQPGKTRPLGIPCIRDRVVQTAVVILFEPIFEDDLQPEQYAYRPHRSSQDAVRHVMRLVRSGFTDVVDADLSGYFDNIPHAELMKSVSRRVSDGRILRLIKMWLENPAEEIDKRGRTTRTTRNKDEGKGSPQGSPISPMLANIYMRRFILGWKKGGVESQLQAYIVNYADDFVICCRSGADQAMEKMRNMMSKLKLPVNEEKTRRRTLPEESFDFLSHTFGQMFNSRTGEAYLGARPSQKAISKLCAEISEQMDKHSTKKHEMIMIAELNRQLKGWVNYFNVGSVNRAYHAVNYHVTSRLRRWLCKKHKVRGLGYSRFPDKYLYELGLYQLRNARWGVPKANV